MPSCQRRHDKDDVLPFLASAILSIVTAEGSNSPSDAGYMIFLLRLIRPSIALINKIALTGLISPPTLSVVKMWKL